MLLWMLRTIVPGCITLPDSLENKKGYTKYWDDVAKAPYLFNARTKYFITYDDERSIREKCDYIKKNGLAGAMFWEYADDKKEYSRNLYSG